MTILHGTSCTVARGAITTVIGPNGAGKSTMFKTVFGMLPARSGRIAFDGADITNLAPRELLARGISYVPQGRNIFPELSVRHNLELGAVMAPAGFDLSGRMDAAMDRFPVLRRKANAQASTLSGGEQKMLEIARSLLLEPKLMLIDEPSIGLSPIMVNELFAILREMRGRGITVLLIEQNAKRALEILRPRHRAGAWPHAHRRHRAGDPRRPAHRAAVPGRGIAGAAFRHSGRAERQPESITTGRRFLARFVVMDSGLAAARRPGMTIPQKRYDPLQRGLSERVDSTGAGVEGGRTRRSSCKLLPRETQ